MKSDRPRISAFVGTSLDGYIAKEDDDLLWLESIPAEGEDYGFATFFEGVDVLIMGRRTYEVVSGFDAWPYEGKRVIVLSGSLGEVRPEAELYTGPIPDLLRQLFAEGVRHVYVDGGYTVSSFLAEGYLDALTMTVLPIVLGKGIRLFQTGETESRATLVYCNAFPSGIVQLSYRFPRIEG